MPLQRLGYLWVALIGLGVLILTVACSSITRANIHAYAEHANRYTHSCASRYAYACANIHAYAEHANTRSFAWRDVRAGLSVARRFIGKLGATGPT